MFAFVAASTGWTWDYIGRRVTLPRLFALNEHWRKYPPVHISLAAFAGTTAKPKPSREQPQIAVVPKLDNAALWRDVHTDPRKLKWVNERG